MLANLPTGSGWHGSPGGSRGSRRPDGISRPYPGERGMRCSAPSPSRPEAERPASRSRSRASGPACWSWLCGTGARLTASPMRCRSTQTFGCCMPFRRNRRRAQDAQGRNRPGPRAPETVEGDAAMNDDMELVRGSGNVFSDFGYPDAELRQAKALLAAEIIKVLDGRRLSTRQAEALTGVAHAE